jgi:urease accessory protein
VDVAAVGAPGPVPSPGGPGGDGPASRAGEGLARPGRQIDATLAFACGGGRTVLARQRVPYPFHVTRPFYLDPGRPDIATLYLQSASGGIYRDDRLGLSIEVGSHAAAHVTTQAATIVHDTHGRPAAVTTRIAIGDRGFASITPDPIVLFPHAEIACRTEIVLAAGASAIISDGLAYHDPNGRGRAFGRYRGTTLVRNAQGALLLSDRGALDGDRLQGDASPLGPYRAVGTMLVLGAGSDRCPAELIERRLDSLGCLAGLSMLPNNAGIGGRILATDGGALRRGLEAAFAIAFEALTGLPPARRRK